MLVFKTKPRVGSAAKVFHCSSVISAYDKDSEAKQVMVVVYLQARALQTESDPRPIVLQDVDLIQHCWGGCQDSKVVKAGEWAHALAWLWSFTAANIQPNQARCPNL